MSVDTLVTSSQEIFQGFSLYVLKSEVSSDNQVNLSYIGFGYKIRPPMYEDL